MHWKYGNKRKRYRSCLHGVSMLFLWGGGNYISFIFNFKNFGTI